LLHLNARADAGDWSIKHGHDVCEQIEQEIVMTLPKLTVFTHLEPIEDSASMSDQQLDRLLPPNQDLHDPPYKDTITNTLQQ
jgi:hypothetical protein